LERHDRVPAYSAFVVVTIREVEVSTVFRGLPNQAMNARKNFSLAQSSEAADRRIFEEAADEQIFAEGAGFV
jgi:hypothetical protein